MTQMKKPISNYLIDNPITEHKNARWFAAIALAVGYLLILLMSLIPASWSVFLGQAGLIVWFIPVMWIGHKYAHGG